MNATVVAMHAKGGVTREDQVVFIRIMVVAASLLGAGYLFGSLLLAPVHCEGPVCAWGYQHLPGATVMSFAGLGCLALAAANTLPRLFLPLGAGILGYTALTSIGSIGTIMLVVVDLVLVAGVIGWILMTWRPRYRRAQRSFLAILFQGPTPSAPARAGQPGGRHDQAGVGEIDTNFAPGDR